MKFSAIAHAFVAFTVLMLSLDRAYALDGWGVFAVVATTVMLSIVIFHWVMTAIFGGDA